ncbi:hypothetical protein CKK21_26105 [Enterobacter cloacae]|nr:hypothetical protein CKK21_26105 [Enterobacter cloacae]
MRLTCELERLAAVERAIELFTVRLFPPTDKIFVSIVAHLREVGKKGVRTYQCTRVVPVQIHPTQRTSVSAQYRLNAQHISCIVLRKRGSGGGNIHGQEIAGLRLVVAQTVPYG